MSKNDSITLFPFFSGSSIPILLSFLLIISQHEQRLGPLEDDVKDLNGNVGEISKLVKVIYKKMEDSDNRCKGQSLCLSQMVLEHPKK